MRKVYKKRDEDAVSPVIATILMVAITVVLAAVLYVMVIGMSEGGGDTAPVGAMASMTADSPTSATLTFSSFAPVPAPMDLKIILTPSTGNAIDYTFKTAPDSGNVTMTASSGAGFYMDLNSGGNAVNSGDYMKIYGIDSGVTYTISIFHYPSDSVCSMTGTTSFQTPP